MALQNTKAMANGESGNYWKITGFSINKQSMTVTYSVNLFVAQQYSATSPIKGTNKTFTFSATKSEMAGDMIAWGYAQILAKANTVVRAAQEAVSASPGHPAKAATPIVYGDADLHGATAV